MKNKKLRNTLLCALAVPTVFMMTGCKDKTEPISMNEYVNLVYEAGTNYYKDHSDYKTFKDMSVSSERSTTTLAKQTVSYKATAEASDYSEKQVTITTTETGTQVVDINKDETENGDISIKVTQTSVSTEKGERANTTTELLESYEETTTSTAVYTFVKVGEEYKLFKHSKYTTKATGQDDSTGEQKQVKTFANQEAFKYAIESVLEEVDDDLVDQLLSAGGEMTYMSPETYKGKDSFGMTFTYSSAEGYNGAMSKMDVESKAEFRNNLPYAVRMSADMESSSTSSESEQSFVITYSSPAIAAPSDSADYTANEGIDYNDIIQGPSFG